MAFIAPRDIDIDPNVASTIVGPEGSRLWYAYSYPSLYSLPGGATVDTFRLDLFSPFQIGIDIVKNVPEALRAHLAGFGVELLAVAIFEAPFYELTVPPEICINFLGDRQCLTPLFAGQTITAGYRYRVWFLSRDLPGAMAVRGFPPLLSLVGLALVILAAMVAFAAVYEIITGELTFSELADAVKGILRAPGQGVGDAIGPAGSGLTGPALAFGLALVAGGVFLPMLASRAEFGARAGPITGGVAIGSGGGRVSVPTPPPPERRPAGPSPAQQERERLALEREQLRLARERSEFEAAEERRIEAARKRAAAAP